VVTVGRRKGRLKKKPLIFTQEKGWSFGPSMFLSDWELGLLPSFLAPPNAEWPQDWPFSSTYNSIICVFILIASDGSRGN
jgi:hypothetical protein